MSGDIKLDGNKVIIESNGNNLTLDGPFLMAKACDFWLWDPNRLKSGTLPDPTRRAMIHTFADGVGINVNRDYPGGVEIGGDIKILDKLVGDVTIQNNLAVAGDLEVKSGLKLKGDLEVSHGDIRLHGRLIVPVMGWIICNSSFPMIEKLRTISKEMFINSGSIHVNIKDIEYSSAGIKIYREDDFNIEDEIIKHRDELKSIKKELEELKNEVKKSRIK